MTGLLVAGFHRSGTSAVAQVLHSHGIPMGDELMEATPFNPFGYFESWPVVRFHDKVLARMGKDWAQLLDTPVVLTRTERNWLRGYVARREKAGDWAVKDPRICRFGAAWKDVAPQVKVLVIYRAPAESAHSLNRRAAVMLAESEGRDDAERLFVDDPDHALKLWVEHNETLVALHDRYPDDCIVLGYHHVLAGYRVMDALGRRFGIRPLAHPDASTIAPDVQSAKSKQLWVTDMALAARADAVWQALQSRDLALAEGRAPLEVSQDFAHDPSGKAARAEHAALQVPILYNRLRANHNRLRLAEPLIGKMSKPPFSWILRSLPKYRAILDRLKRD